MLKTGFVLVFEWIKRRIVDKKYDLLELMRINWNVCIKGVIKAGFAGDQIPKCIFSNLVGRPKHVRVMAGALEGDTFIGI